MARKVEEAIPPTVCKYWTLFKQLISLEPSLKHISNPDEYRESLLSGSHAPTFVEIYAIGLAFGAHIKVVRGSKIIDICPDNLRMVELVQNSQDGSFSPPIGTGPIPSAFAAIPPIPLMPEPPPDRTEANGIDSSPPVTPAPCLLQLRGMRPALVECLLRSNFADEDICTMKGIIAQVDTNEDAEAAPAVDRGDLVALASSSENSPEDDSDNTIGQHIPDHPMLAGATAETPGCGPFDLPDILGLMRGWRDLGCGVSAQPVLAESQSASGDQFYILGIIDLPQKMLLDTGSSYSLMHRDKAVALGGVIVPAQHNVVRTINGAMVLNSKVSFVVDFIVCKLQIDFLIADDPNYHVDMIIVGSPALQAYNVLVDCDNFSLKFGDSLELPMIPNSRTAEEHMKYLVSNFISLVGFDVMMQDDVVIEPETVHFLDYRPPMEVAERLNGVFVHFEAERMHQARVYLYDLLISPDFDWLTQTLRLPVRNKSSKRILVRKGKSLGTFKTVVDPERAKKLNDLPPATYSTLLPRGDPRNQRAAGAAAEPSAMGVFAAQEADIENAETVEAAGWDPLSEAVDTPEWLKEKMQTDAAEQKVPRCDITRIVPRDDMPQEEIDKAVEENQRAVEQYWDERGRDALMEKISLAKDLSQADVERINDITWAHRGIMGAKLEHVAAGLRNYAVDMAYDPALVTAAAPRPMSLFQRELLTEYLRAYVRANILESSSSTPLSNCFLVEKKNNKIKSREDLKHATPEILAASFRLVVDMAHLTPAVQGFQAEMLGMPRFLSFLRPGRRFLTLDGFQYFYQVPYTMRSRPLTAIHCGGDTKNFQRACMGTTSSSGTTQRIGELIFSNVEQTEKLFHADNFNFHKPTMSQIIDLYEENLSLCKTHNLLLKPEEITIGQNFEDDTEFTMLGYSFRNGRVFPPTRKVSEYMNMPLPTTYKKIKSIVCSLSFFRCLSPAFAKYHYDLATEVQRQRDASSRFSLTPEMVKNLRYLLHMVVHSNGLSLLRDIDVSDNAFCVFCDASGSVFGAALTVLRGNKMVAIYAVSRCLPLSQRSFCSNRKEAIAAHHSLVLLAPFLKFKKFFLVTDSAFVYNALRSPIKTLPAPIRSYLASMREEFTFRTLLCRSQDNLADVMTRFTAFEEPLDATEQLDCHLYLRPRQETAHMADQVLDDKTASDIRDLNASFAESLHEDVEDVITKSVTDEAPICFAAEAVGDNDLEGEWQCRVDGSCCALDLGEPSDCNAVTRSQSKAADSVAHQTIQGRVTKPKKKPTQTALDQITVEKVRQMKEVVDPDPPAASWFEEVNQDILDGDQNGITDQVANGPAKIDSHPPGSSKTTPAMDAGKAVTVTIADQHKISLSIPPGAEGILVTPVKAINAEFPEEIVSSPPPVHVEEPQEKIEEQVFPLEPVPREFYDPGDLSVDAVFPIDDETLEVVRNFSTGEPNSLNHVMHEADHLFGTCGVTTPDTASTEGLPKLRVDINHGQALDGDIIAVIDLLTNDSEVQPHQAYHKSPFFNHLFASRSNLVVRGSTLLC